MYTMTYNKYYFLNFKSTFLFSLVGEFKFTNAYRHFIKTKDVVIMRFLKILFSGPPRLGKTTALRRLIGEIIDLLSAGEANLVHSSTGAVESKRNMIVRTLSITTALVADTEWRTVYNHSDEACMLFQMLQQSLETKHVPSTSIPATDKMDTRVTEKAPTTTLTTATAQQLPIKRDSGKPKPTLSKLNISTPPNDIPVVVELFKKASAQPYFAESMQHFFKAYLRIEDTGGQPELMDMLPALAISPGLYLLFFNLEWNLKKEFKVYYQHSPGKATTPEESKITLEEMLLSTLSSISCSCAPANRLKGEEANNSEMHDILDSSKSLVFLVGTHKDKVSEEKISELDKDLQCIMNGTDFFDKDLVQFCSEDKLIVAMNNMDGGVEEVETIKKMLNQAMERHFKPLSIPAVWLLLNLCLRMNKDRTASMKSVLELSSQFNMSEYETKVALWFLHHHAGVMMYFPNVPILEDLVILDSQVVYDSVTFLILRAMSFDNVGHACSEKFEKSGQFVLKDMIYAMDRVSGGDVIPPKKLIALLKFLHIIAPISDQHTCSSVEEQDEVYLMPCVLRTASKHHLDAIFSDPGRPLHVAPLMIRYKCGFVPLGIFPALIASLIPNKSFRLVQRGMMKNKVQFHHQPLKTLVSFLCYPRFYAIVISKLFVSECEVHKECAAIREQVVAALEQVSSRMNYGNFVDYQFAFECPSHPGKEHLCVVEEQSEATQLMECLEHHDCRQPEKMASVHTVWWCEVSGSLKSLCLLLVLVLFIQSKPESPGPVAVSTKQASTTEYLGKCRN